MSQSMILTSSSIKHKPSYRRSRYPLLGLVFPISFQLDTGEFVLKTLEMSHEEIRVACTASEIPLLVPRTAHHRPDEKILHQAILTLDTNTQLNLNLQVLTCRRYSQKEFHIGFRIVELNDQSQSRLEKQLQKALQQNANCVSLFG
ncbi:MAG: hypothetical protein IBX50_04720 [Marinospirillum sp.]|uniref:hypothetical protein n=1 Tax=Marinospirillum sp. TaxID=2183934 RepID=UPI0019E6F16F|nr:hypothetical protein [Marinospirillum sp.]MBE0506011.1 hypothetical protein [Marinospirillum sp.]